MLINRTGHYTWRMRFLRLRPIRATLALLLALAIGFALAEEMVADVHDGGATHAEFDRVTGETHLDGVPVSTDALHPDPATSPQESDHAAHVCHCTHAHGGMPTVVQFLAKCVERPGAQVFPRPASRPMGINSAPATRPPIA